MGIWICAECLGISLLFLLFTSGFDFGGVSEKSAWAEGRRRAKSTQKTGGPMGAVHQRVCVLPRPVNGAERGIN